MPRPRIGRGEATNIRVIPLVVDGKKTSGAKRWRKARPDETPGDYRATCRYRGSNGYTKQAESHGSTEGQARARLRAKIAKLTKGVPVGGQVSVEYAATQWISRFADKVKAGDVTQQTWDMYSDAVQRLVIPNLGGLTMGELTTGAITQALDEMSAQAPSNARVARVVMKHVVRYAMQQDWLERDVMVGTDTYRTATPAIKVLSADELRQVRRAVKAWQGGNRYGPPRGPATLDALDLMLGTGARIGEALALRWEDVDMGTPERKLSTGETVPAVPPTITIAGTMVQPNNGKLHRQDRPKTKQGYRQLVIGPSVQAMLLRRAGELYEGDGTMVFPARGGGLMSPNNFRRGLREALKQADIVGFHSHLLRKLNATTVADAVSLEAAAANLGHSNTKVTRAHYAARPVLAPDVSDAAEALLADLD